MYHNLCFHTAGNGGAQVPVPHIGFAKTTEEFLKESKDFLTVFDFDGDGFAREAEKFLAKTPVTVYFRRKAVKKIISAFCREILLPAPEAHFPLTGKTAYMTDDGKLYFPLTLLKKCGGTRIFAILLHELSHLALACTTDYGELLRLDKLYKSQYADSERPSPVEFYAIKLCCALMRATARAAENTQIKNILSLQAYEDERQLA